MFKTLHKYLILAFLFLGVQVIASAQLSNKIKALWIVQNIAPSTHWKNESAIKEYVIGVYGSNEIYKELLNLSTKYQIKNKPYSVIYIKRTKDIIPTQILYVSSTELDQIPEIFNQLAFNTLFITDQYKGNDFMLNFFQTKTNERDIDINPNVSKRAGITFDDNLLSIAGKDEVLRSLYNKTANQLQLERKNLEQQKIELEAQKEESQKLKRQNQLEREEIERQKLINLKQKSEIDRQKSEISVQNDKLDEVKKNLSSQLDIVNRNTSIFLFLNSQFLRTDDVGISVNYV